MPTPVPKNSLSESYYPGSLSQRSQRSATGTAPGGSPVGFCAPPILGAVHLLMERTATEEAYFIVFKTKTVGDPPRDRCVIKQKTPKNTKKQAQTSKKRAHQALHPLQEIMGEHNNESSLVHRTPRKTPRHTPPKGGKCMQKHRNNTKSSQKGALRTPTPTSTSSWGCRGC